MLFSPLTVAPRVLRHVFRRARLLATTAFLLAAAVPPAHGAEQTHAVRKTDGKARPGEPTTVSVAIEGKNGWHVNADAPITLSVTAEPGVVIEKAKLSRTDLAESKPDRARFDVKCSAAAVGSRNLTATANFVMCQETACKPVKETVTLALEVGAGAAGQPAGGKARANAPFPPATPRQRKPGKSNLRSSPRPAPASPRAQ